MRARNQFGQDIHPLRWCEWLVGFEFGLVGLSKGPKDTSDFFHIGSLVEWSLERAKDFPAIS